jgi:hypothetical protein
LEAEARLTDRNSAALDDPSLLHNDASRVLFAAELVFVAGALRFLFALERRDARGFRFVLLALELPLIELASERSAKLSDRAISAERAERIDSARLFLRRVDPARLVRERLESLQRGIERGEELVRSLERALLFLRDAFARLPEIRTGDREELVRALVQRRLDRVSLRLRRFESRPNRFRLPFLRKRSSRARGGDARSLAAADSASANSRAISTTVARVVVSRSAIRS